MLNRIVEDVQDESHENISKSQDGSNTEPNVQPQIKVILI